MRGVLLDACPGGEDVAIEGSDAGRRALGYVELDIGHAQHHAGELPRRLVAQHAIAPWAGRLDMVLTLDEVELRALQQLPHVAEAHQQRLAIGDHQADAAAQKLALLHGGQMELAAAPDIDPHIVDAGHHVGSRVSPSPLM